MHWGKNMVQSEALRPFKNLENLKNKQEPLRIKENK